ncbi:MAG: hypothetical protein ACI80K_002546 [Paracoccaceae bacterium]|jgi:uncharacterized protein (TIGR00266 family)
MDYKILCQPSYAMIELELERDESITAESGAMAWMDTNITTKTQARGGIMAGLKRKILSGESFFQNTYTAKGGPGSITLCAGAAGDVVPVKLDNDELILERGAFIASDDDVKIDSKFDGFKGLFNEGLFVLRCTGSGTLFFGSYGDITEIEVDGEYVVDNGYAVAWDPSLTYRMTRARRVRSFLFGDQLILRFSGRGRLWVQSRSPRSLANWVHPFRRVQRQNND